jgi:hypothetical protein
VSEIRLPRRAVLGAVLSVALMGAGLSAFAASATAGCSFTDPAGDSSLGLPGSGDDDLDMTAVGYSTQSGALTGAIKVVKLTDYGPENYPGDDFELSFTVNKKVFLLGAYRDFNPTGDPDVSPYVYVDGDSKDGVKSLQAVYDLKASTFSISIGGADLEKLAGTPAKSAVLTALSAKTYANFNGPERAADTAAPKDTKTTYAFGAKGCNGAPAAAPAKPAPSASPSASPKPSASPSAAPAATSTATVGDPLPGCATFADPKGDAVVSPLSGGPGMEEPDLDLTGLVLQSTPEAVRAFLRVDQLSTRPESFPGHSFSANFTVNKKAVQMVGTAYDPEDLGQIQDGAAAATEGTPAQRAPKTRLLVDGTYTPSSITAVFDIKKSMVTLSVPRAELAKAVGGFADGTVLTLVYGRDTAATPAVGLYVDSTAKDNATGATAKDAWTVGDNRCFAAPVSPLSSVGAVRAQYADTAAVAARLLDAAGKPVAGQRVTFTLGRATAVATTGKNGVAKASLLVQETAGRRSLVLRTGDLTTTVPFTVLVEKVALRATATAGAITATLADDDGQAVALQTVTFTSGGRTVTARTDANGVAEATGFARGAVVRVSYRGVPGRYSAATTSTEA